jgi:hypothetical protein
MFSLLVALIISSCHTSMSIIKAKKRRTSTLLYRYRHCIAHYFDKSKEQNHTRLEK